MTKHITAQEALEYVQGHDNTSSTIVNELSVEGIKMFLVQGLHLWAVWREPTDQGSYVYGEF